MVTQIAPSGNGIVAPEWRMPKKLNELPDVDEFDYGFIPECIRGYIRNIADRLVVAPDGVAAGMIVALAACVGRRLRMQPRAKDAEWTVVPNLWGALIAEPGEKKSPIIREVFEPIRAAESRWEQQHCEKLSHQGKRTPERIRPGDHRILLINDCTWQALQDLFSREQNGLLWLRDELSGWFEGLHQRGQEGARQFYLECWDGDGQFRVARMGRDGGNARGMCLSIFGGCQPDVIQRIIRRNVESDGLLPRFQVCVWPDKVPFQLPDVGVDQVAKQTYGAVINRLLSIDGTEPVLLNFKPDAQEEFDCWFGQHGWAQENEQSIYMRLHLAKYNSLVPTLAVLFHAAQLAADDCAIANTQVGVDALQMAIDYADYLRSHARRLYGVHEPGALEARLLAKRISDGCLGGQFRLRDVYYNGWSGLANPRDAELACILLESAGWIREITNPLDRHKRSHVYAVNPRVLR